MTYDEFKIVVAGWFDGDLGDSDTLTIFENENAKELFGFRLLELLPKIEAIDLIRALMLWNRYTTIFNDPWNNSELSFRMDLDLGELYEQLTDKKYLDYLSLPSGNK